MKHEKFFKDENPTSFSEGVEWLERKGFERNVFGNYFKEVLINHRTFEFVIMGEVESSSTTWSLMIWASHEDFKYKIFWEKAKDFRGIMEKGLIKAEQVAKLKEKAFLEEIEKGKGLEPWAYH